MVLWTSNFWLAWHLIFMESNLIFTHDLRRQNPWNMMKNLFLLIYVFLELLQRRYIFIYISLFSSTHVLCSLLNSCKIFAYLCKLFQLIHQCRAFAKVLHYKEMEFEGPRSWNMDANPAAVVEALIHINNQLHQHEVVKIHRRTHFKFYSYHMFAHYCFVYRL